MNQTHGFLDLGTAHGWKIDVIGTDEDELFGLIASKDITAALSPFSIYGKGSVYSTCRLVSTKEHQHLE
jgi:hypothetical protein